MSQITGNVLQILISDTCCIISTGCLEMPQNPSSYLSRLTRFTELAKFTHKHYSKLYCIASKLGAVGPLLYVAEQLLYFSVRQRHQSGPGEEAAQRHIISETQDRK